MKAITTTQRIGTAALVLILTAACQLVNAQGVGIGTTAFSPVSSAMLEMRSTTQGLLVPRMTQAQKTAIVAPATGLLVYQTDGSDGFYYYDGAAWQPFGGGGGADDLGNHTATQELIMSGFPIVHTAGHEGISVLASGFVGVGDVAPAEKLEVTGGNIRVGSAAGTAYGIQLQNPAGTFTTTHKAGAQTADITYTWPTSAPSNGQVLQTDGSGNLSWNTRTEWSLTGNTATNPALNYLGTTDAQPLCFATSGSERMRINATAAEVGIGMTPTASYSLDIMNSTNAGRGVNVTVNSLTSGTGLNVASTATGFTSTNGLGNITLSGNNAANTGTVMKVVNSGGSNTGTALMVTNAANGLAMRVNDDGTDADATPMVIDATGQMAIGATAPNTSAILDVVASNKGIRIPNVALTNTTDAVTIASPATSLMVYNTATAGVAPNDVTPGYYYNSGTAGAPVWTRFATGTGSGWGLTGNAGTNPATNYMGTSEAQPLRIGTSGSERVRVNSGAAEVGIGMTAAANNSLDITNTTTGGRGVNVTANSLTGGTGLSVASSAMGFTSTDGLGNITLSGNNAANTGTVMKVVNSGASNTGTALMVTNAANGLAMRVNDDGTDADATPFVISADGNAGIGLAAPNNKLHVRGGDNSSSVGAATTNILQFLQNTTNNGSVVMNMEARTEANTFSSRMGINPTYNVNAIGPSVYAWYVTMNADQRQIFMYDYPNRNLHLAPGIATINNVGIGLNQPTVGSKLTLNGGLAVGTASGAYSTTAAPAGGAIIENNVGIGNTNPAEKLHVSGGNIRIANTGGTTFGLQLQNPAGTFHTKHMAGAQTANITYTWPLTAPAVNGAVLTATTGGVMSWDAFLTPTTVQSAANDVVNPASYNAGTIAGMSIPNVPAGTYLVSFNANMTRSGSTACSCVVRAGGADQMDTERNFEIPAAVSEFTLTGRITLAATGTVEIRCQKTTGGAGFTVGKRAMSIQRSN